MHVGRRRAGCLSDKEMLKVLYLLKRWTMSALIRRDGRMNVARSKPQAARSCANFKNLSPFVVGNWSTGLTVVSNFPSFGVPDSRKDVDD